MLSGNPQGDVVRGPPTLVCYICGREYGTSSLKIHQPKCAELFRKREALKPKKDRRKLPQPPSEAVAGGAPSSAGGGMSREQFNEQAMERFNKEGLVPCPNCGRTFLDDRLKIHLRSCRATSPARPIGAKAPGGGGGAPHRGKAALEDTSSSAASASVRPLSSASARQRSRPSPKAAAGSGATGPRKISGGGGGGGGQRLLRPVNDGGMKKVARSAGNANQRPRTAAAAQGDDIEQLERRLSELKVQKAAAATGGARKRANSQTPAAATTATSSAADPSTMANSDRVAMIQLIDDAEDRELLTEDEAEKLHAIMASKDNAMLRDVYLAATNSKKPVERFAKNARRTLRLG